MIIVPFARTSPNEVAAETMAIKSKYVARVVVRSKSRERL